jgi:transcriptional regulator with XRE-family HTH domain
MHKRRSGVKREGKGALLRTERQRRAWTQQHLADFAQVSVPTVQRAERGEALRVDTVRLLCDALGKTPQELGLFGVAEDAGCSGRGLRRPYVHGTLVSAGVLSSVQLFAVLVATGDEG